MPTYCNKLTVIDGNSVVREIDLSQDTVSLASHIMSGYYGHLNTGERVLGTGQGGATSHTIYFEFSDSTNTSITGYWDSSFISDAIVATTPATFNSKIVTLAQLDGVTWYSYNPSAIPLNTQLIDFSKVTNDYVVSASYIDGEAFEFEWASVSDYTEIDPAMTFTYMGASQFDLCFYDSSKAFISGFNMGEDTGSSDQIATGTLTPAKIPANAKYVRIDSYRNPDNTELSLIRTA